MQPPHVIFIDLTYGILVISDSYGVPFHILNIQCYLRERIHYDKTPMQYTANFNGCKNDDFQVKQIFSYFCLKHRLWVIEAVLTSIQNQCFRAKLRRE